MKYVWAGKCIHEIFEAQAHRTPDAVAVVLAEIARSSRMRPPAIRRARHLPPTLPTSSIRLVLRAPQRRLRGASTCGTAVRVHARIIRFRPHRCVDPVSFVRLRLLCMGDVGPQTWLVQADGAERRIRRFLRVIAAHLDAARHYVPPPYQEPVTLLRANDLPTAAIEELLEIDPSCGWRTRTALQVRVHVVPGNHFSLIRPPHVRVLADTLRGALSSK